MCFSSFLQDHHLSEPLNNLLPPLIYAKKSDTHTPPNCTFSDKCLFKAGRSQETLKSVSKKEIICDQEGKHIKEERHRSPGSLTASVMSLFTHKRRSEAAVDETHPGRDYVFWEKKILVVKLMSLPTLEMGIYCAALQRDNVPLLIWRSEQLSSWC